MIKETHVGLVIMNSDNTELIEARYVNSKWERELGDVMTIDNKKYRVGVIGDTRNDVIQYLNKIIKGQNKIVRRQQRIANAKANAHVNKIFADILNDINL